MGVTFTNRQGRQVSQKYNGSGAMSTISSKREG
jgi:YD repeat-containing protein